MKQLFLLRHAKSSWSQPQLDDFERPLNDRGHRDAPVMGKVMKKMNIIPDLIISSPALRAAFTARIVAESIGFPEENLCYENRVYEASSSALLETITGVNDIIKILLLVGHNPGLTDTINYLSPTKIENLRTCGLYGMKLNIINWHDISEECGTLLIHDFPKNHRDLY